MKIINKLSRKTIPISEIKGVCTNPCITTDSWHTKTEMKNSGGTRKANHVPPFDHQLFALHDDGRKEGAVWFPIDVIKE